jgi:uncharacterized protein (UPF0335 family)
MSEVGHNTGAALIKAFVERIERMEDEIAAARIDLREIYKEAKGQGFDTKALRKIVALRKQDQQKLAEERAILEIYADALGMEIFS